MIKYRLFGSGGSQSYYFIDHFRVNERRLKARYVSEF